eukprot:TRINITY_DN2356_c0_g1_i1.p1 TRINITY_DN2356_c0_g1~~TRINITY_DN2356_c0_g1_i1.p1  ORF type:complete len:222 (-),score=44.72 TRINITY_DN2356_c0_g1_i1:179-808(-)
MENIKYKPRTREVDFLEEQVLPRLLSLYSTSPDPSVWQFYDEEAVFQDPLVKVRGKSYIKAQFAALFKLLKDIQYKQNSGGIMTPLSESSLPPRAFDYVITGVQSYSLYPFGGFSLQTTTRYRFKHTTESKHKNFPYILIQHEDQWNLTSVLSLIPLLGCFYTRLWRPVFGTTSSWLFQVLFTSPHSPLPAPAYLQNLDTSSADSHTSN